VKRLAWVVCWLTACAGTETGNPSFRGSLGYDAYSSAPDIAVLQSALTGGQAAAIEVQSAWLVLGDVRFIDQAACSANMSGARVHDVRGLGAGDHAATQAPPTSFELESGRYCGARLQLLRSDTAPAGGPDELAGHSMLIRGLLRDGRRFELRSAFRPELFLRASNAGFELDSQQSGVLIGFDVAAWLDELDWSDREVDTNGVVLADETHNRALLEAFESRVPAGITLFRDADRDGLLDAQPVPLAEAAR
jgi:hypothetical protein